MISETAMNLYIRSHSTDKSDTEEYIEYSNIWCIGCIAAYTSGDYVYFNNMSENTKRHHIGFTFNKRHGMYITPPLNITEEKFVSFPE